MCQKNLHACTRPAGEPGSMTLMSSVLHKGLGLDRRLAHNFFIASHMVHCDTETDHAPFSQISNNNISAPCALQNYSCIVTQPVTRSCLVSRRRMCTKHAASALVGCPDCLPPWIEVLYSSGSVRTINLKVKVSREYTYLLYQYCPSACCALPRLELMQ
jgi:hypothetical protein